MTIDDITTAAGISRQTLFRLFPSKADLVRDELDASLRAAFVAAEQDPDRGPCGRSSTSSPSLLLHRTYETLQERMTVAVGRATGLTAPAELVAHALVAFGLAAMVWWADHDAADSTAEILDLTLLSPAKAAPVGTDVPPQACGVRAPGRP